MRRDPASRRPACVTAAAYLLAIGLAGAAWGQHAHPAPPEGHHPEPRSLSADQWRADLRFLARAIRERHPHPFHSVDEEAFSAAVERLDARIPDLSYPAVLVELSRLVALLGEGDGHSRVRFRPPFVRGIYPVRLWLFADGLFVRSVAPEHAELAGRRVLELGGLPADEAVARLFQILPGDNDFDRRVKLAMHLPMAEIVEGLGLAHPETGLEIGVDDGSRGIRRSRLLPASWPAESRWDLLSLAAPEGWIDLRADAVPPPATMRRLDEWYWMEPLENGRALFVQLNAIGNQEGRPTMAAFFERVFEHAEEERVERLILDVRFNDGGNNFFNRAVVHGLIRSDKLNRRGRTYVLIGRGTFSAAQNLVTKLARETEAVFVGEPSGGKPNHYGDARRVTLPASGLEVSISTLYWQDGGPFEESPWVAPDYAVDVTSVDWAAGRDPVLEAALRVDPEEVGRPFDEMLVAAFQEGGLDAAVTAYQSFKADPAHRYADTERTMNRFGYHLLQNRRVEEAIRVFRLNVEAYPRRWNPHDSLGEGLTEAGQFEEAIDSYERSLRLNPNNEGGARALARLRHHLSAADPGGARLELEIDPLVDLYYEVRAQAADRESAPSPGFEAAVKAARAVQEQLGSWGGWGAVDSLVFVAADAAALAIGFGELPEPYERRGRSLSIRDDAVRLARELDGLMPRFLAEQWPARREALQTRLRHAEAVFLPTHRKALAFMMESLGISDPGLTVPMFLVTRANPPGAMSYFLRGGDPVSVLDVEVGGADALLFETILHEATHALDLASRDRGSAFATLRELLAARGVSRGDDAYHTIPHTLMFVQAEETMRRLYDPGHLAYGDATDLYRRTGEPAVVERRIWRRFLDGEIGREEALRAIVDALVPEPDRR